MTMTDTRIEIARPADGAGYDYGQTVTVTLTRNLPAGTLVRIVDYDSGEQLAATRGYVATFVLTKSRTVFALVDDGPLYLTSTAATRLTIARASPALAVTSPADGAAFKEGSRVVVGIGRSDIPPNAEVVLVDGGGYYLAASTEPTVAFEITGPTTVLLRWVDRDGGYVVDSPPVRLTTTPPLTE